MVFSLEASGDRTHHSLSFTLLVEDPDTSEAYRLRLHLHHDLLGCTDSCLLSESPEWRRWVRICLQSLRYEVSSTCLGSLEHGSPVHIDSDLDLMVTDTPPESPSQSATLRLHLCL